MINVDNKVFVESVAFAANDPAGNMISDIELKNFLSKKLEGRSSDVERWQVLQETINWVKPQQKVSRNSPAACIAKEQKILGN